MKTSVLLNILIILLMFSSFSVVAEKDSEVIQRMAAVEQALQQMAEISTQGAQTVQRLGENVEKLASDYGVFKRDVLQRLTAVEQELESLRLLQQKPFISALPKIQKEETTAGDSNSLLRVSKGERPIEKTAKLIRARNVYSPIHRAVHYTSNGPQVLFYTVQRMELGGYRVIRQEYAE
jgi:hypothetical protein